MKKGKMQSKIFELEGALLRALSTLEDIHPMDSEEPCEVYETWVELLKILGIEAEKDIRPYLLCRGIIKSMHKQDEEKENT